MWLDFIAASLLLVLVLYAPGYCICRAFNGARLFSAAVAPVFSIALLCLLGVAYHAAGISASLWLMAGPLVLVAVVFAAIAFVRARKGPLRDGGGSKGGCSAAKAIKGPDGTLSTKAVGSPVPARAAGGLSFAKIALLYVGVSVLTGLLFYVAPLASLDASIQTYDNNYHYALVRSFLDSGNWCSLHSTLYGGAAAAYDPLIGDSAGGFYPSAWHALCALVASTLGVSVGVAANAVNFVGLSVVLPLALFYLMAALFGENKSLVAWGALGVGTLGAFPLLLLDRWPLFPNSLSMTVLPLCIAAFVKLLASGAAPSQRMRLLGLFLVSAVALAFAQPNSVFSAGAFLIPYCVYRIVVLAGRKAPGAQKRGRAVTSAVVAVLFFAGLWVVVSRLPFLQGVVGYYWDPIIGMSDAAKQFISLGFGGAGAQFAHALLYFIGLVWLFRSGKFAWIGASSLFVTVLYCAAATLGDVPIKHVLSGFWYTDPYRLAALAGMCAIPAIAAGAFACCAAFCRVAASRVEDSQKPEAEGASLRSGHSCGKAGMAFALVLAAGVVLVDARPLVGLAENVNAITSTYTAYDSTEQAFVEQVEQIVPEGALVVNSPLDGSMFAHGLQGLNCYYRFIQGYESGKEAPESVLIRTQLCNYLGNGELFAVLEKADAEYVLILDKDGDTSEKYFQWYSRADWQGIEQIDEETPGFELLLHSGDSYLYRITYQG